MTRIALYGGSFNPPHIGHVQVVSYVLSTSNVDAVWLLPTFQHAFGKALAPFEQRLEMCRLALRPFAPERAQASDIERTLGGESRTIDTVEALMEAHADSSFDLVIGADILEERHLWKRFDRLEQLCRFIVIGRRGYEVPAGFSAAPPLFDVSATQLRSSLAVGASVENLLPASVEAYIRSQRLYCP